MEIWWARAGVQVHLDFFGHLTRETSWPPWPFRALAVVGPRLYAVVLDCFSPASGMRDLGGMRRATGETAQVRVTAVPPEGCGLTPTVTAL